MFNTTLNNIAKMVEDNLFNPAQSTSLQPWHVPKENIFDITETPAANKKPRVVFTLGRLEADLRTRMEASAEQPDRKRVHETLRPAEHEFALTYPLQERPIQPVIKVTATRTNGTQRVMSEGDDFVVDYTTGEITFRQDVHDIDSFEIEYRTDEVVGTATTIHITQHFSLEVVGEDSMKAEAITAISVGVLEAFKEDILAEEDRTCDNLHVISLLKPIDIQLVNKQTEAAASSNATVMLHYQMPGIMRIAKKVPEEELCIMEKIFHPDIETSQYDVALRAEIMDDA